MDLSGGEELYIYGKNEGGYGLLDTIAKSRPYVNYSFSNHGDKLWMLNNQYQLKSYDMSDLTDIILLDEVEFNSASSPVTGIYIHAISKIERGFIAVGDNTIFSIVLENGQYVNHREIFYRGGEARRVVVKDDKLYIPINNRIDVVDISSIDSPSLLNQVISNVSYSVGDLYPLEDNILSLTHDNLVRYVLDNEGVLNFYSSLDIDQYLSESLVSNTSLFVLNNDEQILRYDISSANSFYELPYESESLTGLAYGFDFKVVVDDYLIFAGWNSDSERKLYLLDDVFENVTFLSSLAVEDSIFGIAALDGYVYTVANSKLNIYQIDNDELVIQKSVDFTSYPSRVDIIDGLLLVASYNNGAGEMHLYSLADPATPQLLSTTKLKDGQFMWGHSEVVLDGSNIFITTYSQIGKTLILQLNKAPELAVTNYTFEEDTPLIIDLSVLDPENDQIQVEILVAPESGELIFNEAEQSLNYQPAENFFGEQTANVKLLDPHGNFSESVIHFSITAVNDLPFFHLPA